MRQINFAIDAAHSARLSGHVSLGFPPTISALIGIPLMKLMSERYPDIRLEIVETLSGNLIQSINSRQLDIAIIFTHEIDKQWAIQPLVKEQMYLMARKEVLIKHGLSDCLQTGIIQSQQIGDIPLVLPDSATVYVNCSNTKLVNSMWCMRLMAYTCSWIAWFI